MIFMTDVLFALLALHGLSASWYQSGQCNDTTSYKRPISVPYNLTLTKPSVQLELLPVYCFIVSLRGCCVALSSVTRSFQVVLVLSNVKGLLHLGIHVFLESRLVTLNI